jgi:hypothetical protein
VGQKVLRKTTKRGNDLSLKFDSCFEGPFEVEYVNENEVTYVLSDVSTGRRVRAHHAQLRRYVQPPAYLADALLRRYRTRCVEDWHTDSGSEVIEPAPGHRDVLEFVEYAESSDSSSTTGNDSVSFGELRDTSTSASRSYRSPMTSLGFMPGSSAPRLVSPGDGRTYAEITQPKKFDDVKEAPDMRGDDGSPEVPSWAVIQGDEEIWDLSEVTAGDGSTRAESLEVDLPRVAVQDLHQSLNLLRASLSPRCDAAKDAVVEQHLLNLQRHMELLEEEVDRIDRLLEETALQETGSPILERGAEVVAASEKPTVRSPVRTRSQGYLRDVPRVQPRTLEYQTRRQHEKL